MYKKILVPLDGSELAEQVLPLVIELAKSAGSQLILLRVPDVPMYETMLTVSDFNGLAREQAEIETREYLERLGDTLRARGLQVRIRMAHEGAVYTAILETAKESGVDLIAMSTHGRSGLARLVMGSVADDVVRHATVPILLVRPQPVPGTKSLYFENTYPSLPVHRLQTGE